MPGKKHMMGYRDGGEAKITEFNTLQGYVDATLAMDGPPKRSLAIADIQGRALASEDRAVASRIGKEPRKNRTVASEDRAIASRIGKEPRKKRTVK